MEITLYTKVSTNRYFSDDDLIDTFVVKGGSAIDLIYKLDARASVDIDLSIHYSQQEFLRMKLIDISMKYTCN